MTSDRVVAIRAARHAPLVLAHCPAELAAREGDVVLAKVDEALVLAVVAVPSELVRRAPSEAVGAWLLASGSSSPEVAAAIAARDAAALAQARETAGPSIAIVQARWSLDLARLTVVCRAPPDLATEQLQNRLSAVFRAEIRLVEM